MTVNRPVVVVTDATALPLQKAPNFLPMNSAGIAYSCPTAVSSAIALVVDVVILGFRCCKLLIGLDSGSIVVV